MPWWAYLYYVAQIYACLFLFYQGKGWQKVTGLVLAVVGAMFVISDMMNSGIIIIGGVLHI